MRIFQVKKVNIAVLKKVNVLLGAALVTLLTVTLAVYPKESVEAATAGLKIFWEIVLPSLLPFFVLSEIMLGMGVVHFIGVLLEPLMRPVFNVPGAGAFALSMGLAAGYPMDAVITGKFRRNGMCTQVEGERLLSFTNTADPLFIFGAVAVGMFGRPQLGVILAIAHYLSSFTVGFIYRYYRRDEVQTHTATGSNRKILPQAVRALLQARREDGRPFGKIMGDAVRESMSTLLMIGGFIMIFSVLVRILAAIGVLQIINPILASILKLFGLNPILAQAVFNGILEIDLGTMAASQVNAALIDRTMVASWIIGWSGLCVHGQVASVVHDTDIRMGPYVAGRLLHGLIAAIYTGFLMGPLFPVFAPFARLAPVTLKFNPLDRILLSGVELLIGFGVFILAALVVFLCRRYRLVRMETEKSPS
ncbi:MAG TPA: sporulation integral membrane protein YlbJ [Bacillota bacterium]